MNSTSEEYGDYEGDYLNKIQENLKEVGNPEEFRAGHCKEALCVITVIFNVIIFLLGIIGNGAVIWITGFKMRKSVNTTWYLSLALSDFIFCSTLPLVISRIVMDTWIFGLFMCKFTSFVMNLNMYSSIFILVIIIVHHCIVVKFPVWAQNRCTVKKASLVVLLVWFVSALFSIPSAYFRNIASEPPVVICYSHYEHHHSTVVFLRFTFGFLIPLLIISTCYSILICKLKLNQMSKSTKPYKIMTLLITAFFLCWLPFQIVSLVELGQTQHSPAMFRAQQVSVTLASVNSFLNPFLYAFMAKNFNKKCYSFLSKIESAIDEET